MNLPYIFRCLLLSSFLIIFSGFRPYEQWVESGLTKSCRNDLISDQNYAIAATTQINFDPTLVRLQNIYPTLTQLDEFLPQRDTFGY